MTSPPRQPTGSGILPPRDPATVTRHLSVGAFVDEVFAATIVREVLNQPRRQVAPAYGFDLIAVLGQCRRALRLNLIRDWILTGSLIVGLCLVVPALQAIWYLVALQLTISSVRLLRDAARQIRAGSMLDLERIKARAITLFMGFVIAAFASFVFYFLLLLFFLSAAAPSADDFGGFDGTTGEPTGSTEFFDVLFALSGLGGLALPLLALVVLAPILTRVFKQREMEAFVPGRQVPRPPMEHRFLDIEQMQRGNVVAFHGYHPFVGSGVEMDRWSAAIRLIGRDADPFHPVAEARREFPSPPFSAKQLSAHVAERLALLRMPSSAEEYLPGLSIEDRIYLAAAEAFGFDTMMSQEHIDQIIANPTFEARHMLALRVVSWRGELVTTVYVHFAVQGRTLHLELASWALPPCPDAYRVMDGEDSTGALSYLKAMWRGFIESPAVVAKAPLNVAADLADRLKHSQATRRRTGRELDFGARVGVRDLAMSDSWRNSLLENDFTKYSGIIERRVIAATLDFLDQHGVDTTEFRQRTVSILNKGILHTGAGDIRNAGAVGDNATVTGAPPARAS